MTPQSFNALAFQLWRRVWTRSARRPTEAVREDDGPQPTLAAT